MGRGNWWGGREMGGKAVGGVAVEAGERIGLGKKKKVPA